MNRRPIFIGEGESADFYEVLPKQLTLTRIDERFYPKNCTRPEEETIFEEVKYKKFEYSEEMKELMTRPKHPTVEIPELYEIFKMGLEKVWIPEKFHIIGHSSGVDSRIICKAIRELAQKNGKEWLGDVLYIENGGEGIEFRQIQKELGIPGVICDEDKNPGWYHEKSFEFDTFYQKFNGAVSYPINQWYDGYNKLYEQGIIPKDVQGITGYGANETQVNAIRRQNGYAWYFPWAHQLQLALFKHWGGDWAHPFLNIDFLHALKSNVLCNTHKRRFNVFMAAKMVPELYHIRHIHTKQVVARGYRHVDKELLKRLYNEYRKSWFGSQFDVETTTYIQYREWWFFYGVASLCEHLIEEGYEITLP